MVATDGSALGNPGPGGWAWVTSDGKSGSGGVKRSTNNRMELTAVLELLRAFPHGAVLIQSDSQYVINIFTKWLAGWRKRGMRTSQGRPVGNADLIEGIDTLLTGRDVKWEWVRAHVGHPLNEQADHLAWTAASLEKTAVGAARPSKQPRHRRRS